MQSCFFVVGGTVDVATLSQIIVRRIRDLKTSPEELKDAFQVFDKQGTGMISVHDLKLSLTTLGERLADEELDELIREVDQDGEGMVNYQGVHWPIVAVIVVFIIISSLSSSSSSRFFPAASLPMLRQGFCVTFSASTNNIILCERGRCVM